MLKILHAADLQFGSPFRARAGEAFLRKAHEVMPHFIVIAGDLTQRAKPMEFRAAWGFLQRLPAVPLIVTPGNHDVPLYRIWERALVPFWNWKRFIPRDLDSVARVAGATIVGLSSASPRRAIVNGRIGRRQLSFARKIFDSVPPGEPRILTIHHHFVPTPDGRGGQPLPGAARIVREIEAMGVELVLGGHVHQTHMAMSGVLDPTRSDDDGIPLIACGTTTSRRGRGPEAGRNSLNVIELEDDVIRVTPYFFQGRETAFQPADSREFSRGPVRGAYGGRTFSGGGGS
jgi:3',5'-cyclic AMP phosphodiesterase CpdA